MKDLDKFIIGRGEVNGFTFTQLFSSPFAYMYEKRDVETGVITYEVFRRVYNSAFDCVSYPRSSGFGSSIYKGKELYNYDKALCWFEYLNDTFSKEPAVV